MAGMILVKNLVDMGFTQEDAQIAVAATECAGVQPALEWLLKNEAERPTSSTSAKSQAIVPLESSVVTKHLLVDEAWELLDPTPDIHALFVSFCKEFFWDKLGGVEVKWSPRMTSCAGICSFKPKSRECVIALSKPLLSLRPRKDLVETLLHEMIHAFLFLDSGTTDREGHGEQFHYHMYRINKKSGTHITVYHSFNEEVRHYRTHWWKCDGPCQHKPPYFGVVKRAMNRAPGPNDFWFEQHRKTCGGTYIKIREPEKDETKTKASQSQRPSKANAKSTVLTPTASNTRKITEFFPGNEPIGVGTLKKAPASKPPTPPVETNQKPTTVATIATANVPPFVDLVPDLKPVVNAIVQTSTSSASSATATTGSSGYVFPGVGRKLNENSAPAEPKKMKPS